MKENSENAPELDEKTLAALRVVGVTEESEKKHIIEVRRYLTQIKTGKLKTTYRVPQKRIKNPMLMAKFINRKSFCRLMQFLCEMQMSVRSRPIS